jgi:hypothetical protein
MFPKSDIVFAESKAQHGIHINGDDDDIEMTNMSLSMPVIAVDMTTSMSIQGQLE